MEFDDNFKEFAVETAIFANRSLIEIEKGTKGQEGLRKSLEKMGKKQADEISDDLHNTLLEYRESIVKIDDHNGKIFIRNYEKDPEIICEKYGEFVKKYGSELDKIKPLVMTKINPVARSSFLNLENMFMTYKQNATKKIENMSKESIAYA